MGVIDRTFRLTNEPGGLGLSCGPLGLSLAGVPLLQKSRAGFAPRPPAEIEALVKAAYGAKAMSPELLRGSRRGRPRTQPRGPSPCDDRVGSYASAGIGLGTGQRALRKLKSSGCGNTIRTSRGIGMGAGQAMVAPTRLAKTGCRRIQSISSLGQVKAPRRHRPHPGQHRRMRTKSPITVLRLSANMTTWDRSSLRSRSFNSATSLAGRAIN